MASIAGSSIFMQPRHTLATTRVSGLKLVSFMKQGRSSLSFRLHPMPARYGFPVLACCKYASYDLVIYVEMTVAFFVNNIMFMPELNVIGQAKPETVDKVCEIVRKQLALSSDKPVTGESKFSDLGADSLDTVEIVMGLEEQFGITVEEDNAQSITTVQDAADLIEKLCSGKST